MKKLNLKNLKAAGIETGKAFEIAYYEKGDFKSTLFVHFDFDGIDGNLDVHFEVDYGTNEFGGGDVNNDLHSALGSFNRSIAIGEATS